VGEERHFDKEEMLASGGERGTVKGERRSSGEKARWSRWIVSRRKSVRGIEEDWRQGRGEVVARDDEKEQSRPRKKPKRSGEKKNRDKRKRRESEGNIGAI